ncbi:MAG: dihydroorotate dehydrogenase electron transfer subunit [Lachnospiraceae bacterium]
MGRKKERAIVQKQTKIGTGIYDLWIETEVSKKAVPGQFISIYTKDASKLLPRPISICEIEPNKNRLRVVYRIAGEGTKQFSKLQAGDEIEILGPLGNGFTKREKKAILIGGGIGIPPMLELAKQLDVKKNIVLGYRDEIFLNKEFEPYGDVFLASEDGAHGTKGTVLDAIRECAITGDVIYACGPTPMLRAIQAYALENHIEAQLSLEEKMACGVGACLACVCKSREIDSHSHVHNKRVCKDGPVFDAREVDFS